MPVLALLSLLTIAVLDMQTSPGEKEAASGTWTSRFRSFLLHGAHLAHLDSLLTSTKQQLIAMPQAADMASFLDVDTIIAPDQVSPELTVICTSWVC